MRTQLGRFSLLLILAIGVSGCDRMPAPGEWNSYAEQKAHERFQELCKTQAMEHIYKTVDKVEGYLWVSPWNKIGENLWGVEHQRQTLDQYGLVDPYDYHGDGMFSPGVSLTNFAGARYNYVEVSYPSGDILSYSPRLRDADVGTTPRPVAEEKPKSRYVVTFTDVSDKTIRDLWVGGGHLKITDSQSGELLAERIGFVRGLVLGDHLAGPWSKVAYCEGARPSSPSAFITKVLKPVVVKPPYESQQK